MDSGWCKKTREASTSPDEKGDGGEAEIRWVTGSRKSHHQLKAVRRTADVFLGRMGSDVSIGSIKSYIQETFEIHVYNIEESKIVTDEYKVYKIISSLDEREKLFNPSYGLRALLWISFLVGPRSSFLSNYFLLTFCLFLHLLFLLKWILNYALLIVVH